MASQMDDSKIMNYFHCTGEIPKLFFKKKRKKKKLLFISNASSHKIEPVSNPGVFHFGKPNYFRDITQVKVIGIRIYLN